MPPATPPDTPLVAMPGLPGPDYTVRSVRGGGGKERAGLRHYRRRQ